MRALKLATKTEKEAENELVFTPPLFLSPFHFLPSLSSGH